MFGYDIQNNFKNNKNMSKLNLIACLIAVIFLTNCGGRCLPNTFNKTVISQSTNEIKVVSQGQKSSLLNINDLVSMSIGGCHPWSNVLCAVISPKANVRVRFESNQFNELNAKTGELIATYTPSLISYSLTCDTNKKGVRTCDSSEKSATNSLSPSADRVVEHQGKRSEVIFKTFDSKLEFSGAIDSSSSISTILRGYREYKMLIIPNIKIEQTPTIVRFPKIIINDRTYDFPEVKLVKTTEKVCHYTAW